MADEVSTANNPPPAESVPETAAASLATEPANPELESKPVETSVEKASEPEPAPTTAVEEHAAAAADTSMMDTSVVDSTEINGGSITGTPVSTSKSSNKKKTSTPKNKLHRKKSMPNLHLDVEPGQYWYVRMKGYAAWPAIICDEDMLPVSLLERRPVSAMRPDGTWREDFLENGKNVRDRRYPVMFLGTNEFAWQVNTELADLDMDEIKEIVAKNDPGKKTKALWNAFVVASENHDLEYFKKMLKDHEDRMRDEEIRLEEEARKAEEAAEAKRLEKEQNKNKKAKTDVDGDVVMGDGEDGEKKKPSKKRKPEAHEDAPKKTKIVLKGLNKDTGVKAEKKARPEKPAESTPEDSALDEEEKLKRKEKTILYLRHKLQKGLVSRENPPRPEEMGSMSEHLATLEQHSNLEAEIITTTKVNKLLKVILKLTELPRDEEFTFKDRCEKLLAAWNKTLEGTRENGDKPSESNGHVEKPVEEKVPASTDKPEEKAVESTTEEPKPTNGASEEAAKEVKQPEKVIVAAPEESGEKMEVDAAA